MQSFLQLTIHAQNIAFHEVGRQAIMNDPLWKKGSFAMASNQFDVSNQIRQLKKELDVKSTKTRLVAGFYNESLTVK